MSLNSLKIATDGYLKRTTKAVLVIAVAGYLNFNSPPLIPPTVGGGGGGYGGSISSDTYDDDKNKKEFEKQLEQEDIEIMYLLKIFFEQC